MSERSDSTREVLLEIGDRARGIVEELARQSRVRAEQAAGAAAAAAASASASEDVGSGADATPLPPDLVRRLGELRACVGQVADVLEGAVERLETVESQLGDPQAGVEEQLRLGIARCEDLLLGIEHRVLRTSTADAGQQPGKEPGKESGQEHTQDNRRAQASRDVVAVLVVSPDSRRRARLCLALEGQGLHTLAASDLRSARSQAERHRADVALVDLAPEDPAAAELMEGWRESLDRGALPRPLVLGGTADAAGPSDSTHERMNEEHGEAAMAARLTRMARGDRPETVLAH